MKLLICIDDTDNLTSKGTGTIAQEMMKILKEKGIGKCGFITRHQLFLHEDIKYTSHNSSMCFNCEIDDEKYDEVQKILTKYLENESAEGSDPGICIAKITDKLDKQKIINFGYNAKREVKTKQQAYDLAHEVGVYLQEVGGAGEGVIGAIAGIGLRIYGNDGEIKGSVDDFKEGETYFVNDILKSQNIDDICTQDCKSIPNNSKIYVAWKVKPVMVNSKRVLLVKKSEKKYTTMVKKEMRKFGDNMMHKKGCENYKNDVAEEKINGDNNSCYNCLYRRWTEKGIRCTYNKNESRRHVDALVIGGGVVGAFVARNLIKTKMNVAVLEKNEDVCCEVTKANTAIVHCGYSAKPTSIKGKMSVPANENFDKLCDDLQVEFLRCGSIMIATGEKGIEKLHEKIRRGTKNGVKEMYLLTKEETLELEPNINPNIKMSLYAPSTGVVNPWELGIAAMENAIDNGAKLYLNTEVTEVTKQLDKNKNVTGYIVKSTSGEFFAKYVINCAGLHSDEVSNMVTKPFFKIKPRRGEYFLLDKKSKGFVKHVIFTARENDIKGVIVSPTVGGNILVGPSTEETQDKDDCSTTIEKLEETKMLSQISVRNIPFDLTIRTFSGLRPRPNWVKKNKETGEIDIFEDDVKDFIIGEPDDSPNFINVGGIKSPGLTCADEIGKYVANIVTSKMENPIPNNKFNPKRKKRIRFAKLSLQEQKELIEKDKNYATIVCKCGKITKAEVLDAIHRNCGAKTVDGVKRRAGTSLGRCQGGFCTEKIVEILAQELDMPVTYIKKDFGKSQIITDTLD